MLIRRRSGWTLRLAAEPDSPLLPDAIDVRARRTQLRRDGVDWTLVALSGTLGIETDGLRRADAGSMARLRAGRPVRAPRPVRRRGCGRRGSVREERLALGRPAARPIARMAHAGSSFAFAASDIHRVLHAGAQPAVTIHAYSPPLVRMGAYVVEADGQLRRHAITDQEELRPLEPVRG